MALNKQYFEKHPTWKIGKYTTDSVEWCAFYDLGNQYDLEVIKFTDKEILSVILIDGNTNLVLCDTASEWYLNNVINFFGK